MADHRVDLDRIYKDRYGIRIHVIGWDPDKSRVIFMRDGYAYECALPVKEFKKKFTRLV
ncbi:DUF4222 domain-containing protein [Sodalis sp. RH21]|uniref:DUF4222 domain-containing protein n=1 Tax=unclassified Sodalis (in: enterobacteria) TaxID=2636512 RepID=UPI0039B59765